MRGRDAGLAEAQAERDDAAPVAVVGVEWIARQRHRLLLELGMELAKLHRLLRQIAVDVAERAGDLVHDADAVLDQAERHAGLQQDEAGADFLDEWRGLFGQDQIIRHEHVAELHAIGAGAIHGEERLARLQRHGRIGAVDQKHDESRRGSSSRSKMVPNTWSGPRLETQGSAPRTM